MSGLLFGPGRAVKVGEALFDLLSNGGQRLNLKRDLGELGLVELAHLTIVPLDRRTVSRASRGRGRAPPPRARNRRFGSDESGAHAGRRRRRTCDSRCPVDQGSEQTNRLVVVYRPDAHPGDRCQLADIHTDTVNPDAHVRVKNYAALNTLLQLHFHMRHPLPNATAPNSLSKQDLGDPVRTRRQADRTTKASRRCRAPRHWASPQPLETTPLSTLYEGSFWVDAERNVYRVTG